MSLALGATMTFTSYAVQDTGIMFHFVSPNPGPGNESDWYVFASDADLAAVASAADLRTLLQTKLNRKLRAAGIASKLDPFLGQSLIV